MCRVFVVLLECHNDNVVKLLWMRLRPIRHERQCGGNYLSLYLVLGSLFNVALRVSVCFQLIFMNYKLRLSGLAIATFILFYGIIRIINMKWSKMLMTMGIVGNAESINVCFVKMNMENVRLIVTKNMNFNFKIINPDLC